MPIVTLSTADLFDQPVLRWVDAVILHTRAGRSPDQIADLAVQWARTRGAHLDLHEAKKAVYAVLFSCKQITRLLYLEHEDSATHRDTGDQHDDSGQSGKDF